MFFGMNTLKRGAIESANLECVCQDIVISREYLFLLGILLYVDKKRRRFGLGI